MTEHTRILPKVLQQHADRLSNYVLRVREDRFSVLPEYLTDDPDNFIVPHAGQVLLDESDDDIDTEERLTPVGRFGAFSILASPAATAGMDITMDVCDAIDQSTYEVAEAVYGAGNRDHFRKEHKLREHWGGNVLYVDYIELDEKHRGFGLGLAVLLSLARRFGEDRRLVVARPWPLQYSGKDAEEIDDEAFKRDTAKLAAYWSQLGFAPLLGWKTFLVLDLHTMSPWQEWKQQRG